MVCELDVCPVEGLQFAHAQAGVEGGRPQRLLTLRERVDEGGGFVGAGDAVATSANGGKVEPCRWIDGERPASGCASVDARSGMSAFRMVLGERPCAESSPTMSCSAAWSMLESLVSPRVGRMYLVNPCR